MVEILFKIFFVLIAYILGCIPFGLLLGKIKGIDIRKHGSKNIGATNTARVLGKKYFIIVFILDSFKSFILVFLFRMNIIPLQYCIVSPLFYGLISVLGHCFPIFLNFKGGKAVSCCAGSILGFYPLLFVLTILVFIICYLITKTVSICSLISGVATFIFSIVLSLIRNDFLINISLKEINENNYKALNIWFVICIFIMISLLFIRHSSNIKRIKARTEKPTDY